MKKKKFVFVILHYLTITDTIACVKSIKSNCREANFHIVVVDNGSHNGSGEELRNKYGSDRLTTVISSKENLGFARGNNLGFAYAKKNLHPDYIILCNNDTLLLQNDFCERVERIYNKSHFAVLGPKILLKNGEVNGIQEEGLSVKNVRKRLLRAKFSLAIAKIGFLYGLKKHTKSVLRGKKVKKQVPLKNGANAEHKNLVLHGCFLIFSKEYFSRFTGLDPRTFLYCEEELLYLRLVKNKMASFYSPEVVIKHNEDSATDASVNNDREKEIFVKTNQVKSLKILIKEMEVYEKQYK